DRVARLRRARPPARGATAGRDRRPALVPDPRRATVLARAGTRPVGPALVPGPGHLAPVGVGPRPDPGRRQPSPPPSRGEAGRVAAVPSRHLAGRLPTGRGRGLAAGPEGRRRGPVPAPTGPGPGLRNRRQRPGHRLPPGLPGVRLGAAAGDRGLAVAG